MASREGRPAAVVANSCSRPCFSRQPLGRPWRERGWGEWHPTVRHTVPVLLASPSGMRATVGDRAVGGRHCRRGNRCCLPCSAPERPPVMDRRRSGTGAAASRRLAVRRPVTQGAAAGFCGREGGGCRGRRRWPRRHPTGLCSRLPQRQRRGARCRSVLPRRPTRAGRGRPPARRWARCLAVSMVASVLCAGGSPRRAGRGGDGGPVAGPPWCYCSAWESGEGLDDRLWVAPGIAACW